MITCDSQPMTDPESNQKPAPVCYVAGFMRQARSDKIVLVRKLNPAWQRGLLNGVGGKIEAGETPDAAMMREWREETGHTQLTGWRNFALLTGVTYKVYFYKALVPRLPKLRILNDVGERIEIVSAASVPKRNDIIANLKWLIPMAFDDFAEPFAIVKDKDSTSGVTTHEQA